MPKRNTKSPQVLSSQAQKITRRRSNLSPNVDRWLYELLPSGWSARRIHAEIKRTAAKSNAPKDICSLRTVESRLAEYRSQRDPSGEWQIAKATPEDVRLVLDVIADVASYGYIIKPTNNQAMRLVRLLRIAPDLAPRYAWHMTLVYAREPGGATVQYLDALLAFGPWRSEGATDRYLRAVRQKLVEWPGEPFIELLRAGDWYVDEHGTTVVFDENGRGVPVDWRGRGSG